MGIAKVVDGNDNRQRWAVAAARLAKAARVRWVRIFTWCSICIVVAFLIAVFGVLWVWQIDAIPDPIYDAFREALKTYNELETTRNPNGDMATRLATRLELIVGMLFAVELILASAATVLATFITAVLWIIAGCIAAIAAAFSPRTIVLGTGYRLGGEGRRMKVIVTGMIGTFPLGGVAWDYCQYTVGLERLGLEVYYLEDSGVDTYEFVPTTQTFELNPDYGASSIRESLTAFSDTLANRWHFRSSGGRTYGMSCEEIADVANDADVLISVSGATLLRDADQRCRRKVFIDTDPGWNHFRTFPQWDRKPPAERPLGFRSHDHFFTFAERIRESDCPLPGFGLKWHATRPPVLPDKWGAAGSGRVLHDDHVVEHLSQTGRRRRETLRGEGDGVRQDRAPGRPGEAAP
jgi:hypothetical protein